MGTNNFVPPNVFSFVFGIDNIYQTHGLLSVPSVFSVFSVVAILSGQEGRVQLYGVALTAAAAAWRP